MNTEDKINDYINSHPRESLMIVTFCLMMIWQTIPSLMTIILYVVLIRLSEVNRWVVITMACLIALEAIYLSQHNLSSNALAVFLKMGFKENKQVWHFLFTNKPQSALNYPLQYDYLYLLGAPLLMVGILSLIELIPNNPHEAKMKALQKGSLQNEVKEISDRAVTRALNKINDVNPEGTVLGVSTFNGKSVVIPDRYINQIALVLGTTGSGKTITLRRF